MTNPFACIWVGLLHDDETQPNRIYRAIGPKEHIEIAATSYKDGYRWVSLGFDFEQNPEIDRDAAYTSAGEILQAILTMGYKLVAER